MELTSGPCGPGMYLHAIHLLMFAFFMSNELPQEMFEWVHLSIALSCLNNKNLHVSCKKITFKSIPVACPPIRPAYFW